MTTATTARHTGEYSELRRLQYEARINREHLDRIRLELGIGQGTDAPSIIGAIRELKRKAGEQ